MPNQLATKLRKKSTWLALALGAAFAGLTAQACSIDKTKYTFIPDDEFADASTRGGQANGGGENGGGAANNGAAD